MKQTANSSLRGGKAGRISSTKIRHIIITQDEQKIEWSHDAVPCGFQIDNADEGRAAKPQRKSAALLEYNPFQLASEHCWPFYLLPF